MYGTPLKTLKTTLKTPEGKFRLREAVTHPLGARAADISKRAPRLTFAPSRRPAKETSHPRAGSAAAGAASEPQVVAFDAKETEEDEGLSSMPRDAVYMLVNVGDTVYFQDYEELENKSPLEHLKFRSIPTCHEANAVTAAPDRLDVCIGFASGDVVVHDPIKRDSARMSYYNKDGAVCAARVNAVRWLPRSSTQFLAALADGNLLLFDREREDGPLQLPQREPDGFYVQRNGKGRANPVARWHVSRAAVHDAAFSPDGRQLATVSRDGLLRVFAFDDESLLYAARSYFGALLCVAWSPDGKFLLTGGEDDLCCVWAAGDRGALVCRCEGHRSFVHAVAWDPWASDPARELYRFGSAGQDGRLCLWDFARSNLAVTKKAATARASVGAAAGSGSSGAGAGPGRAAGAGEVPVLRPVVDVEAHHEPLTALAFLPHSLATACAAGQIKCWQRPPGRGAAGPGEGEGPEGGGEAPVAMDTERALFAAADDAARASAADAAPPAPPRPPSPSLLIPVLAGEEPAEAPDAVRALPSGRRRSLPLSVPAPPAPAPSASLRAAFPPPPASPVPLTPPLPGALSPPKPREKGPAAGRTPSPAPDLPAAGSRRGSGASAASVLAAAGGAGEAAGDSERAGRAGGPAKRQATGPPGGGGGRRGG